MFPQLLFLKCVFMGRSGDKVDLGSFDKKPYRNQAERSLISRYHCSTKSA